MLINFISTSFNQLQWYQHFPIIIIRYIRVRIEGMRLQLGFRLTFHHVAAPLDSDTVNQVWFPWIMNINHPHCGERSEQWCLDWFIILLVRWPMTFVTLVRLCSRVYSQSKWGLCFFIIKGCYLCRSMQFTRLTCGIVNRILPSYVCIPMYINLSVM